MPTVQTRCRIDSDPQTAFEFFRCPARVLAISDPSVGARMVHAPEVLNTGDQMRIELMAFGMVQKVVYEAVVDESSLTIDEVMVEGPLKAWRHRHQFESASEGCEVVDEITFEPPGGLAGLLLTADKIGGQLEDGLAYRNDRLPDAVRNFAAGLPSR